MTVNEEMECLDTRKGFGDWTIHTQEMASPLSR